MSQSPAEVWASGEAYEPYVGRWSRPVAREFVSWIGVAPGLRWLDVGCGTGALSETILGAAAPARVIALDLSPAYLRFARNRLRDPRAAFAVADAGALPHASAGVDVVVSGLMLNFVPRPLDALVEMVRVVRAGGVVAVYVWDYARDMQLMRRFWDAAVALDAGAEALDERTRFPICQPDALGALFRDAGLRRVATRAIDVPTRFRDFDDYWTPFLGGQGPAPGYVRSLSEEHRTALRERLRSEFPMGANGSFELVARAWAARGAGGG